MFFLALTLSLAMMVWACIVLVRGTVFTSTALFLVATAVFPAEFFSLDAAGLTWTLDRMWFGVLVLQCGLNWYRGKQAWTRFELPDVALGLFTMWLVARSLTQPWGAVLPGQPPTLMHLINGYLIPITLYVVLRTTRLEIAKLRPAWIVMMVFGGYLSITACLEIAKMWSLVFPSFIGDSTIGIHFGRARGPMLQSVRLGMCLVACWMALAVYTVWLKPLCKVRLVGFAGGSLLLCGAIFLTYTRSVWLGLAASICVLVALAMQGLPRRVAIFGMLSACILVGLFKGPDLIAFKREFSAAETKESTYMRAAFAYVSIQMFKDKPVAGHGFNQFQVYNPPYLDDRSTDIRLNSIRGYVHHNGFLSLLVDLGLIGFVLYLFMLLAMAFQAWSLWRATAVPQWVRGFALLAFAMGCTHMIQMAFHEVSFSSIENGLLFATLGLMVAAHEQYCVRTVRSSIVAPLLKRRQMTHS